MSQGKLLILTIFTFSLAACSFERVKNVQGADGGAVTFSKDQIDFNWIQVNIFDAGKCKNCHSWTTSYPALMAAVGKNGQHLVIAGSPSSSSLYTLVDAGKMPKDGARLHQSRVDALAAWIQHGANQGSRVITPDPIKELNFRVLTSKIFKNRCNTCHGGDGEAFYVDFTTYEGVMQKIDVNDPPNSRIYKAVLSGRMPQGQPSLDRDEIKMILQWITEGAKP